MNNQSGHYDTRYHNERFFARPGGTRVRLPRVGMSHKGHEAVTIPLRVNPELISYADFSNAAHIAPNSQHPVNVFIPADDDRVVHGWRRH